MMKKMIMMGDDLQAKTSTQSEHLNIFPIKVLFYLLLTCNMQETIQHNTEICMYL